MKDELFGLAVAMIAVGIVVPVIMLIPGREYLISILPYTLPILLVGVWLLRVSMRPSRGAETENGDAEPGAEKLSVSSQ